jgi:hypothetical protein
MQTWPNNEQSETDLVDYLFRILCLLFFEQVYCSCSLGIWILKRRPHWTSWVAFDQINTLRTSTSYARCAANEHCQVSHENHQKELIIMAHSQIIMDWMAKTRHSRNMIELFGKDHEKDFNQGMSSPVIPSESVLTTSSGTQNPTTSGFLQHYPALMDPRKVLQMTVKYANKNIVLWANNGRQLPVVDYGIITRLQHKALKLIGKRIPGGLDTLKKIVEIVKSHNRLDDGKQNVTKIRPEVICMNIDAWYKCISNTTASDLSTLPTNAQETPTSPPEDSGTQLVSSIFGELLHDPLFPYCNLQDIPDDVLLEWCASHSYPHVLDKLKVNNPCIGTTQEDIMTRIDSLIRAPVLWIPEDTIESAAEDDSMSIDSSDSLFTESAAVQRPESVGEYFQRCGTCIDDGVADCRVDHDLRQPGQLCTRCESLGEPCEDRSSRERRASLTSETFEKEYRKRQRHDGHIGEKVEEKKKARGLSSYPVYAVRAHLYPLLLDETSGQHGSPAQRSILCLPKRKPDESKILSLVESISKPVYITRLSKGQAASLVAPASSKAITAVDDKIDQDDEMEDEEASIVMNALDALLRSSGAARSHNVR